MTVPNPQPVLPAEGTYTDMEKLFISDQPPQLWPINQNSNFGALRKTLSGEMQDAVDILTALTFEMFVPSAVGYLTNWEEAVGLPKAPTGKTDAGRRAFILGRLQKTRFTRTRRREIIEAYVGATFGVPTDFIPSGIPLTPGGVTMFAGIAPPTSLYTITEDIPNFYYEVGVDPSVTPDLVGMYRELRRITPAGITFNITTMGTTARTGQVTWAEIEFPV